VVGVLMESSPGKAASILAAPDPAAALDRNERGFSPETGYGAAIDDPLADDAVMAKLKHNVELLRLTGSEAVPTLVFHVTDGTAVIVTGAPPDNFLKQIIPQVQ
jgi:thiol:disulfide interchange protein DsbG